MPFAELQEMGVQVKSLTNVIIGYHWVDFIPGVHVYGLCFPLSIALAPILLIKYD
jgi:hypothetical protein